MLARRRHRLPARRDGGAVATTVEQALDELGYRTPRFPGRDRVETAALIARSWAPGPGDSALLVRASGNPDLEQGWVDSVSCGGYAADTGTPVLLTSSTADTVAAETRQSLDRLGVRRVHVCGGPAGGARGPGRRAAGRRVHRRAARRRGPGGDRRGGGHRAVGCHPPGRSRLPARPGLRAPVRLRPGRRPAVRRPGRPDPAGRPRRPHRLRRRPRAGATLCYLRRRAPAGAGVAGAVGGTGVVSDDVLLAAARAAGLPRDTTPPPGACAGSRDRPPEDDGTVLEVGWDAVGEPDVTYTLYLRRADDGATPDAQQQPRAVGHPAPSASSGARARRRATTSRSTPATRPATARRCRPWSPARPTDEVPASPGDQGPTLASAGGGIAVSLGRRPRGRRRRLRASSASTRRRPTLLEATDCDPSNDANARRRVDRRRPGHGTSSWSTPASSPARRTATATAPWTAPGTPPDWSPANGPLEAP